MTEPHEQDAKPTAAVPPTPAVGAGASPHSPVATSEAAPSGDSPATDAWGRDEWVGTAIIAGLALLAFLFFGGGGGGDYFEKQAERSRELLKKMNVELSDCLSGYEWPADIGRVMVKNENDERVALRVQIAIYDAGEVKLGDTTISLSVGADASARDDFSVAQGNQEELARCDIEKVTAEPVT